MRNAPTAKTEGRVIEAAKEAWANIRPGILVQFVETMPGRVDAVIRANGWYTEYLLM